MSGREPGWYWTRWIMNGPWVPVRWDVGSDGAGFWAARSVKEQPIEIDYRIPLPGEPDEATVERVKQAIRNEPLQPEETYLDRISLAAIGFAQGREPLDWRAAVERFIEEYAVDPSLNCEEGIEKRRLAVNRLRILLDKTDGGPDVK